MKTIAASAHAFLVPIALAWGALVFPAEAAPISPAIPDGARPLSLSAVLLTGAQRARL